MKPTQTVASVLAAWLAKEGLSAEQAAPRLGIAVCTGYQYLNGESVPTNTRAPDIAEKLGIPADVFSAMVVADRARIRRARAHARKASGAGAA